MAHGGGVIVVVGAAIKRVATIFSSLAYSPHHVTVNFYNLHPKTIFNRKLNICSLKKCCLCRLRVPNPEFVSGVLPELLFNQSTRVPRIINCLGLK